MGLDLATVASCASAFAAVVALVVSIRQGRMSNRQSLFARRLNIWITVEKLMRLYRDDAQLLKQENRPQLAIEMPFVWMTNTTYLHEITSSISHPLEDEYQLRFHLKLDEMEALAAEAVFVFKGKPKAAIGEFIKTYKDLLLYMYQYKTAIEVIKRDSEPFPWTLEEAAVRSGEKSFRMELYNAENMLKKAYAELSEPGMIGKIQRQIRLVSTPADYLDTFH